MTATVFESRDYVSDFVKSVWDERYCFVAAPVKNALAALAAGALTPGMPLKLNSGVWETLAAANIADADGFWADTRKSVAIASNATTTGKWRILTNGPALVNVNSCLLDAVGAAITQANATLALRALSPKIEILIEPSITVEQTA